MRYGLNPIFTSPFPPYNLVFVPQMHPLSRLSLALKNIAKYSKKKTTKISQNYEHHVQYLWLACKIDKEGASAVKNGCDCFPWITGTYFTSLKATISPCFPIKRTLRTHIRGNQKREGKRRVTKGKSRKVVGVKEREVERKSRKKKKQDKKKR